MKYPGQPVPPPGWHKYCGPSYIEGEFSKELGDLADAIESEHWFGDPEKHSRYRVDFILKDARLIIELDGHEHHSTKEQLEKDAIRQRYLTRAGYSVIRFTGREVKRDPKKCVLEVRTTYQERMQRAPGTYKVMYIDYSFFCRQASKAIRFYREIYPEKKLILPSLESFISHAIEWLHEKSFITAFVFHSPEDSDELRNLNGSIKGYQRGEVRINTMPAELYSLELGEHLICYSHLFDEYYLVADDAVYIDPLRSILPKDFTDREIGGINFQYLANVKLLRKGNNETSYVGSDLAKVRWQDITYAIGAAMGLNMYEL